MNPDPAANPEEESDYESTPAERNFPFDVESNDGLAASCRQSTGFGGSYGISGMNFGIFNEMRWRAGSRC